MLRDGALREDLESMVLRLERQMLLLMQKYGLSFTQIIEFEKKQADAQTLQDFRTLLVDLKERHKVD